MRKARQGVSLSPFAPRARARSIKRRELRRLDFAERRRRADDDRRPEGVRPEDVAERRAALRSRGVASSRNPPRRTRPLRPSALDERAHPPRRAFAGAGEAQETLGRAAPPLRRLARLAFRREASSPARKAKGGGGGAALRSGPRLRWYRLGEQGPPVRDERARPARRSLAGAG